MATLPSQRTWTVGLDVTPAMLNADVRDAVNFFLNLPACRAYNSANFLVATATRTAVTLDSERYDNDGIHSTTTNTSRLTCVTAGMYRISGSVEWANNVTGERRIEIRLNGGNLIASNGCPAGAPGQVEQAVSCDYKLIVGDYVEMTVYQTSGGNLNVLVLGNNSPEFAMSWASAA